MAEQLLHMVFGGELIALNSHEFRDLSKLHIVGIYPNYKEAHAAWKGAAQSTVDNAHMRYFVVHLHRLLEPHEEDHHAAAPKAKGKPAKAPARTKTVKAQPRSAPPKKPIRARG